MKFFKDRIYKKSKGMMLSELLVALTVCGIIFALSVSVFTSNDVTRSPYIYSILKSLPEANYAVAQECYNSGTCSAQNTLPINNIEYCVRLADAMNSTAFNCGEVGDNAINFKTTTGVEFIGITSANNKMQDNGYIDIRFKIANHSTQEYPLRIYKNGEVVPTDFIDDEEVFAYKVILNKKGSDGYTRVEEVLNVSGDSDKYSAKTSFLNAVCYARGEYKYEDTKECPDNSQHESCQEGNLPDNTAFCTIKPVRPKATGLFGIVNF